MKTRKQFRTKWLPSLVCAFITISADSIYAAAINIDMQGTVYSGAGAAPDSGTRWNAAVNGGTTGFLLDSTGAATGVKFTASTMNVYGNGRPNALMNGYLYTTAYNNRSFSVSGLAANAAYDLYLYSAPNNVSTTFTFGSQSLTLNGVDASSSGIVASDWGKLTVTADGAGVINGVLAAGPGGNYSAFNGLQIVSITGNVTPAQWLSVQPKPAFKAGHTLPRLTKYAYNTQNDIDYQKQLAENWGYAIQWRDYCSAAETATKLDNPTTAEAQIAALTKGNPQLYPLAIIGWPGDLPGMESPYNTWTRNASGTILVGSGQSWDGTSWGDAGPIFSTEAPNSVWQATGNLRATPLQALSARGIPVNMVLNGGESGMQVPGWAWPSWSQDPAINAAIAQSVFGDRNAHCSARKADSEYTIASVIRAASPQRNLYIYYTAGGRFNRNNDWAVDEWGPYWEHMRGVSDIPSNQAYYLSGNDGFVENPASTNSRDLLTSALNAASLEIATGNPLSYNWVSVGWTPGSYADITRWTGFLKCYYTTGMIGGNVGCYEAPAAGRDSFPINSPPVYLKDITALSYVHALFSQVEDIVRNSDLLPGPMAHSVSPSEPAYEFPTGDATARVLARKHRTQATWLITAWAADGANRNVTVFIPELGQVTVEARACGSVYTATVSGGYKTLTRLDNEGATYTAVANGTPVVTPVDLSAPTVSGFSKLLLNSSFETPAVNGYRSNPQGMGWVFANGAAIQANGSTWAAANAPAGTQTAVLQGSNGKCGVIARNVNLDPGTYTMTFKAARRTGQIQPVKFSVDGTQVGGLITPTSDAFASYTTASFVVTSAGVRTLRLEATDSSADKSTFIDAVLLSKDSSAVSKIEAEEYEAMFGVLLTSTTDTGGGMCVGYTDPGDWVQYTLPLPNAGVYNLDLRVATIYSGMQLTLKIGTTTIATVNVPNTGGWQAWQTVTVPNLTLPEMPTIRIGFNGGVNFNWLQFNLQSLQVEAENYSAMNGILTQAPTDTGGGLNVGYVDAGDWMDYAVTVPTAGTYSVDFRIASPNSSKQLQLKNGATTLATVTAPNTGGWQTWQTVTANNITLAAGTQTLRVYTSTGGWNLNWLKIRKP